MGLCIGLREDMGMEVRCLITELTRYDRSTSKTTARARICTANSATVAGRISASTVYGHFPFPPSPSQAFHPLH